MLPFQNRSLVDIKGEKWIDVLGYDGIYEISNFGRVKSISRLINDGKGGVRLLKERIMRQQIIRGNYQNLKGASRALHVSFCNESIKSNYNVSVLVGRAFIGDVKEKECYSKKNKIWHDCRAVNLEIKSISESIIIAYEKGNNLRNKKTLTANHTPKYTYIRLSDGKIFIGGSKFKKEYGYDPQSNIKRAVAKNRKCLQTFWEIKNINHAYKL